MARADLDIAKLIKEGFSLCTENLGILIVVHLLALVLSVVSVGIVAGPIMAGVILIVLRLMDGSDPKPQVGDIFDGFRLFANAFLFCFIWMIVNFALNMMLSCVGNVISLVLSTFLMFGLFLVTEKEMAFWPASVDSCNKVKPNFWPLLALVAIMSALNFVGGLLCFVGLLFTFPLSTCIAAVTYREVYGGGTSAPAEESAGDE